MNFFDSIRGRYIWVGSGVEHFCTDFGKDLLLQVMEKLLRIFTSSIKKSKKIVLILGQKFTWCEIKNLHTEKMHTIMQLLHSNFFFIFFNILEAGEKKKKLFRHFFFFYGKKYH